MTSTGRYWVWVFGEIAGLRWVLEHEVMAFSGVGPRLRAIEKGDQAVLYVGRSAFHNPVRDVARLAGLATVLAAPTMGEPVVIQGREFPWTLPIRIDSYMPERSGPEVLPLVPRLSFIRRPEVWGQYFRNSPFAISEADFRVLADAVEQHSAARR